MIPRLLPFLVLGTFLIACASDTGPEGTGPGGKADGLDGDPVCSNAAFDHDPVLMAHLGLTDPTVAVRNYTAWPEYSPGGPVRIPEEIVNPGMLDAASATELIASRFPGCEEAVAAHLRDARPNVYIFFAGYGGDEQNNSTSHSPAILRWVNERDPSALIFAINWNCAAEGPGSFCEANAQEMTLKPGDAPYDRMQGVFANLDQTLMQLEEAGVPAPVGQLPASPLELFAGAAPQFSGEGSAGFAYDASMSHSIHLAAKLVDQLLVAGGAGDINFVGYSMGAQSAARVLTQDFVGDGSGYAWQAENVCEGGGSTCTIAQLDRVGFSLSMGIPGWSEAMTSYRVGGEQSAADQAQYGNGGLLRIFDERYNNKLNVLNRRMDPTSDSHDTLARGLGDIMFGEYNHYSHDYAHPLFIQEGFVHILDQFIEAEYPLHFVELGIMFDNAGWLTFDDCPDDGECDASSNYYAHRQNRSHGDVDIHRASGLITTDGVDNPGRPAGRAVTFVDNASAPFALNTFDQEDLRGGIEMYFRPAFDPGTGDTHGLFSYGTCDTSAEDLMPEAYFADGQLSFEMNWLGERYTVAINAADAGITEGRWGHLAFTWELPTESKTHGADFGIEQLTEHQLAVAVAHGLMRPLRTTYQYQSGQGTMRIYVNGLEVATAALGAAASRRDCLSVEQVLGAEGYTINGSEYPPYLPYAGYTTDGRNVAALQPGQPLGTTCKGYRVRNNAVQFGCARSTGLANAEGDMDEIAIIWGPGRTRYSNVGTDGLPVGWPVE